MAQITLKTAVPGDEKILAHIQTQSWKAAFGEILSPETLARCTDVSQAEEMYRHVLLHQLADMTIELVDGQPHAIAAWSRSREMRTDAAELICLHSLKSGWRQGYGSVLMEHVLAEMAAAGYGEAVLWVFEENLPARRFYEKHGFVPAGERKDSFGAAELLYHKKL